MALSDFYKNKPSDRIWWVDDLEYIDRFLFSFDKKKIYNLYEDYHKLTAEQRKIFDKENPHWAEFFK